MVFSKNIYVHTFNDINNIVINTLTGAIDIVNKEIATLLNERDVKRIRLLDNNVIDCLKKRGYIFDSNEELNETIKKSYEKYKKYSKYNIYSILPTYNCNLACSYCFEGSLTKNNISLTSQMVDSIFEYIKKDEKRLNNKNIIQLFGGEPLLKSNFNIVEQVLSYASHIDIDGVDIITNGTQLDYFLDLLLKNKKIIRTIQVTIDGPSNVHDKRRIRKDGSGTFDQISKNIKKALKLGFSIVARTNLDITNIDYLESLVEYYENNFKMYKNFSYYFAPVRGNCAKCSKNILSEEQIIEKLQILRENSNLDKYPLEGVKVLAHVKNILENKVVTKKVMPAFYNCEAVSGKQVLFAPSGKLYTCGQAVGRDELAVGEFYPNINIDEVKMKKWENLGVFNKRKCSICPINLICGGGCAYYSWENSSTLDEPTECDERFKSLSVYLSKYKEKNNL